MRVALMHLPKTGGTSIHRLLVKEFETDQICPERFNGFQQYSDEELKQYKLFSAHMDFQNLTRVAQPAFTVTLLRDPKQRILSLYYFWKSQRWPHIEKHNLAGPRFAKENSLRDFLKDLPVYLAKDVDNAYARNLIGRLVSGPIGQFPMPDDEVVRVCVRNLLQFDKVGFLDSIDDTVKDVFESTSLPVPPVVPKARARENFGKDDPNTEPVEQEEVTDEIDALLSKYTSLDNKIYEIARALYV